MKNIFTIKNNHSTFTGGSDYNKEIPECMLIAKHSEDLAEMFYPFSIEVNIKEKIITIVDTLYDRLGYVITPKVKFI